MKKISILCFLLLFISSCSDDNKTSIEKELKNPNQNTSSDSYKTSRIDFEKDLNTILKK